jgi:hypothetical protein
MIIEVRTYRVKSGRRAEFLEFFETRAVPALRAHGITVLGPMIDLENPSRFVWMRGFPSIKERERMKTAFYESELWVDELENIAMPMLESWDFTLCETSPGFTSDEFCATPGPAES